MQPAKLHWAVPRGERTMRSYTITAATLLLAFLLSGCQTTGNGEQLGYELGRAVGHGLAGAILGNGRSANMPSSVTTGTIRQQQPVEYRNSKSSYVNRMVRQSEDRLLSTAPCDPAARAQWQRWVRAQSRGNHVGDLNRTPPHCQ